MDEKKKNEYRMTLKQAVQNEATFLWLTLSGRKRDAARRGALGQS